MRTGKPLAASCSAAATQSDTSLPVPIRNLRGSIPEIGKNIAPRATPDAAEKRLR